MLIAILTDIHANREALTACLAHAQEKRAQRHAFLGDLVGYGGDPGWVVNTVMTYVREGAIAVQGNHDAAVAQAGGAQMHAQARQAVEWTRAQLGAEQLQFLDSLPLTRESGDCLFVHATAADPRSWEYITGTLEAVKSMHATHCRTTFAGHVHEPALYNLSMTGKISSFVPAGDSSIPLSTQRRWLVLPGSVGQPRDGNPAACYALFDDTTHELTFFRVPYDTDAAAARIRAAGLPEGLAQRLLEGR
ncbi:MAG TPA: metallophosphoesterase family protein [Noviherbaspirillum sp.]|jgi:diadenosine tetraphosphatase ApaH/serine/threonine PP2A family protein phosphatase|uniref:metallophosphoesterase family protein n=1 Tax=Noviherbaspirillum sp. TaxID=1926288 RepID=UPI002F954C8A